MSSARDPFLPQAAWPAGIGFRTERFEDCAIVTQSQAHVLVDGGAVAIDAFLRTVMDRAHPPIRGVLAPTFEAPAYTDGTLILRGIEALDPGQQVTRLRWLEAPQNTTRVIATSATPVYALVQAGALLDHLFYRLNVIHITVVPD